MAKSTKKAYIRNWNYSYNFLENITQQVPVLPVHTQHVALFIAHLKLAILKIQLRPS